MQQDAKKESENIFAQLARYEKELSITELAEFVKQRFFKQTMARIMTANVFALDQIQSLCSHKVLKLAHDALKFPACRIRSFY